MPCFAANTKLGTGKLSIVLILKSLIVVLFGSQEMKTKTISHYIEHVKNDIYITYISVRGGQMPHITQLSAVEQASGKSFNRYIRPKIPISDNAQQVTGITMVRVNEMMVDGKCLTPT